MWADGNTKAMILRHGLLPLGYVVKAPFSFLFVVFQFNDGFGFNLSYLAFIPATPLTNK